MERMERKRQLLAQDAERRRKAKGQKEEEEKEKEKTGGTGK